MLRYALALCLLSLSASADELTSYGPGPSGGGGGYTTWNPSDKTNITLSNGNLTATLTANLTNSFVRGTTSQASGKVYFEITVNATNSAGGGLSQYNGSGLANGSYSIASNIPGYDGAANSFILDELGTVRVGGGGGTVISTPAANDIIAYAIDITNNLFWFRIWRSGAWLAGWNSALGGTQDPATGQGGFNPNSVTGYAAGPYYQVYGGFYTVGQQTLNEGASSFITGMPPSGFSAWH